MALDLVWRWRLGHVDGDPPTLGEGQGGGFANGPSGFVCADPIRQVATDHPPVTPIFQVDPSRIYVTGLSLGGSGTWHLACKYGDLEPKNLSSMDFVWICFNFVFALIWRHGLKLIFPIAVLSIIIFTWISEVASQCWVSTYGHPASGQYFAAVAPVSGVCAWPFGSWPRKGTRQTDHFDTLGLFKGLSWTMKTAHFLIDFWSESSRLIQFVFVLAPLHAQAPLGFASWHSVLMSDIL